MEKELPGQLLADCASSVKSSRSSSNFDIFLHGPQYTTEVYPSVAIKSGVFGGNDGLYQNLGNFLIGNLNPLFYGIFSDDFSIIRINICDDTRFKLLKL